MPSNDEAAEEARYWKRAYEQTCSERQSLSSLMRMSESLPISARNLLDGGSGNHVRGRRVRWAGRRESILMNAPARFANALLKAQEQVIDRQSHIDRLWMRMRELNKSDPVDSRIRFHLLQQIRELEGDDY